MPRVALITDAQTPLGEQLVRRYLAAGHRVAATRFNEERLEAPLVSEDDRLLLIDWNRTSPISARNVVLAVLNRFDTLDEALLLQAPQLPPGPLQELPYEIIERAVDAWVKGTLFLAKGILELFAQRRGGSLAIVQQAEHGAAPLTAALGGSLRAAARSLAAAMAAGGATRKVRVNSFECRDPNAWDALTTEASGFAEFVLQTMQNRASRSSGRRFRYPGRTRGLGRLVHRGAPPSA